MPLATLAFTKFAFTQDISVEYSIEFCPIRKKILDNAVKISQPGNGGIKEWRLHMNSLKYDK